VTWLAYSHTCHCRSRRLLTPPFLRYFAIDMSASPSQLDPVCIDPTTQDVYKVSRWRMELTEKIQEDYLRGGGGECEREKQ
jgi:hypothetical protein